MDGRAIQMGSKLIVRPSQMAVFVNKGQVADVFGPGTHTLSTSNLPFLTSLLSLPFGFRSPFTCDIFFVSAKQFPNQKWGTANPITMRDKEFGMIRVRGFGSYSFRVDEALTFLKELFGTSSTFKTEDIDRQLRSLVITAITETIASSGVSALDMAANLMEFANLARPIVDEKFKGMGLKVAQFNVENLSFPEEVEKMIDARSAVGIMGDHVNTHVKMQAANAMRDAAQNPNGTAGVGIGMGAGMGMAQMFTQAVNTPMAPMGGGAPCGKCNTAVAPGARFCSGCGTAQGGPAHCTSCGGVLPTGAKFCGTCGHKQ